ncbi:envelope stress response membrane protein PspC [Shewanella acanthi]|uniref:envelope stress response membrane protein PspC n=1 Tax=Shewanella acanthi TaxID=2864212 RepID=UPI001C661A94|nr:envelope stress response membrane protein PspC [Shewanella acanthi]MCH1928991.1 envelope stress response membrane protein PspC [Shewanella shenzhenensis]QYJ77701.1 envelope stress response membrane protein PspC [Shewanella acanthi]
MKGTNGKTLYRIPQSGKVAGVCAGIGEYFSIETWLVRVLAVSIFLLGGSGVVFIIYVALWVILDIKPHNHSDRDDIEVKKKPWQTGEPATQALSDVNRQFRSLEVRLQNLERYVTSDNFDLKRQINNL